MTGLIFKARWWLGAAFVAAVLPVAPTQADGGAFTPAVGRLAYGTDVTSGCSAVLIAPDLALTAGHCVAWAIEQPDLGNLGLALWPDVDAQPVVHPVSTVRLHPDALAQARTLTGVASDLALVTLARPVRGVASLPLAVSPPETVTVALVAFDRGDMRQRQDDPCPSALAAEGVLAIECRVVTGNSGGAALRMIDGVAHLTAILVASSPGRAFAALPGAWLEAEGIDLP